MLLLDDAGTASPSLEVNAAHSTESELSVQKKVPAKL